MGADILEATKAAGWEEAVGMGTCILPGQAVEMAQGCSSRYMMLALVQPPCL